MEIRSSSDSDVQTYKYECPLCDKSFNEFRPKIKHTVLVHDVDLEHLISYDGVCHEL